MSWVRTSTALIGFGFTIVQFFQKFGAMDGVREALHPTAPRYLGLALVFFGIVGLGIAVWQYHTTIRHLWSEPFVVLSGAQRPSHTPVLMVSVGLMLIGVFTFAALYLRLG